MKRCFQLACLGAGHTAPNPMVGAVLVHQDRIIGEGYHRLYGGPHAEVDCIKSVPPQYKHLIPQSTLYVSLEPCNHQGKTPPCTELIIRENIPSVVIACRDLHEKVNGAGLNRLREAGVEVTEGVCETEAYQINRRFFTFHKKKRPHIILKWAQSSDGFLGKQVGRVLISNALTNRLVHRWRSEESAILIGTNTAIADNPSLTTRLWSGKNPVRVVFDLKGRLPQELAVFGPQAKTIVISGAREFEKGNILFRKITPGEEILPQAMKILFEEGIQSLMVEGGASLLHSFIREGLWDEARIIVNNSLELSSGIEAPAFPKGHLIHKEDIGSDSIFYFENPEISSSVG